MTRTSFHRLLKIIGVSIVTILIVAFAVWRSLDYARGPKIIVIEPANGSSIVEKSVVVKGRVERATDLSLNGNRTDIDEQGNFSEEILVFPGTNLITLTAKDQFGRETEDRLTLVGNNGI